MLPGAEGDVVSSEVTEELELLLLELELRFEVELLLLEVE